SHCSSPLFFFNPPATTQISTLSLHDALPISEQPSLGCITCSPASRTAREHISDSPPAAYWPRSTHGAPRRSASTHHSVAPPAHRSEEHTSELQSRSDLVCRLLLEKKKNKYNI